VDDPVNRRLPRIVLAVPGGRKGTGKTSEGMWGGRREGQNTPEFVSLDLVEGCGEEHGYAVLLARLEERQVLQRQRAAAVRDGGGGELLVFLLAADNAQLQAASVSMRISRSCSCACLVDASNDTASWLKQHLQRHGNQISNATPNCQVQQHRSDSHHVVESQHFVQQRAKLQAAPVRDALQCQRRCPDARGRHFNLVPFHQLIHVLERLPLHILEEGQRACFRRSS
jgi:hypothetical protein